MESTNSEGIKRKLEESGEMQYLGQQQMNTSGEVHNNVLMHKEASATLSSELPSETEEVLAENVLGSFDKKAYLQNQPEEQDMQNLHSLQQVLAQGLPQGEVSGDLYKSIHQQVRLVGLLPHDVYEIFMDSEKHSTITGQEAKIGRDLNSDFSAYDGNINGITIELQKDRRIVQKWRAKDWPDNHYSLVTIQLRKVANGTKVTLTQTGVPADKYQFIVQGWNSFYWDKMGRMDEKEFKKNKRQRVSESPKKGMDSNGIEQQPTTESLGTPILHVEIPCKNMDRVTKFYHSVFGWSFNKWTEYYVFFNTHGKQGAVTGGFWLNEKSDIPKDRFVTIYIYVEDINSCLKKIQDYGGEIIQGKTLALPAVGYYAFFRDTEGNQIGLNGKN